MSQKKSAAHMVNSDDANVALRQSEQEFDALVSGVEDYAIFLLSPEGHVISWNAGAQRIKGYKPEEIIGKHFSVFYTQEATERDWPGVVLRIAAKEGRFTDEGWRVRKDGSQFWASMAITAIRAQNGSLRGFWNLTDDAPQRLVHSSGPKWWTDEGSAHLRKFGDKYACFQHFSKPAASSVLKVLVGICSSRTTALRRAAVRDTWMKRLRAGVQAVFFVGRGAGDGETDVFEMTTADDYPGLSSKIHAFCQHALEHHEFDYLFKCDDDTYVVPGRLLELAADNKPFVGSSASAPSGYASGGAGYLISREAVSAIAVAVPPPRQGAEDVWVSNLLRERGFPLTPTPLLQPGHDRLPHLANDIVTAHYCGPELMRVIDRLMTEHARIVAVLNAEHAFWQGPVKLLSNSLFLGGASAPDGRWEWDAPAQTLILQWFHWPPDRLELRDWGLEAPNLRLQFESGHGPNEFRQAMAQLLSVIETQSRP